MTELKSHHRILAHARSLCIPVLLTALVAVASHKYPTIAMLLALLFGLASIAVVLTLLTQIFTISFKKESFASPTLRKNFLCLIGGILLCVVSLHGIGFAESSNDMRLQVMIDKLETYKVKEKRYPSTLEEIEGNPPLCGGSSTRVRYSPSQDRQSFILICQGMGFTHREYNSNDAEHMWKRWD